MSNLNVSIFGSTAVESFGENKLDFTVSISEPLDSQLVLKYSTFDGSAVSSGTGKDYTALSNKTITFAPGETVKTISVDIGNSDANEADENLFVNVFIPRSTNFNPSTKDLLVATGIGTITDTLSADETTTLAESPTANNYTIENLKLTGNSDINGTGNRLGNHLTGNSGKNTLKGLVGNDTLDGNTGSDTLIGSVGDDTYIIDNSDVIEEDSIEDVVDAGIDTVIPKFNNYTLGTNLENLTLNRNIVVGRGNELNNYLTGNDSDNSLFGNEGEDTIQGNDGVDTLDGGSGNDTYIIDNSDTIAEAVDGGTDTVAADFTHSISSDLNLENVELLKTGNFNATGNSINNKLSGNSGNNLLTGVDGDDFLKGKGGDDTLNGGTGNDTLEGGFDRDVLYGKSGDDTYVFSNFGDIDDTIVDESGTDRVESIFSYTLPDGLENLVLIDDEDINATGNDAANTLVGNSGDNVLDGLAGSDIMIGGEGDDTYVIERNTDIVQENGTTRDVDTVESSLDYSLEDNLENLVLTGTAIAGTGNELRNYLVGNANNNNLAGNDNNDSLDGGAGDDSLYGDDGNDTVIGGVGNDSLDGGVGNDSLDGGVGNDTMVGGIGNDTYVVNTVQDVVTETSTITSETDTVKSSFSYTLGENLEKLELLGTRHFVGKGNELNNRITGNEGHNRIFGYDGKDTLMGDDGNDRLYGFNHNDSLDGGDGNDILNGGNDNDTIKGGDGNDRLYGLNGNDSLDGGKGEDTLNGGFGDDTYVVDNFRDVIVTSGAGDGIDTVKSSISYRLGSHLEKLTLTGSSEINGVGNELDNIMLGNSKNNILVGKDGNDSIDGSSGDDILRGGAGDDTLKGISGKDLDTLIGGVGNDDYYVSNSEDVIVENSNEGIDEVFSTATSYTLSENIEDLILSGSSLNGTGNSSNNTITGNSRVNFLDGGWGRDTLIGGAGNDQYVVNTPLDVVVETSTIATEIDLVYSSVNYTLGDNVENLILTGVGNRIATGNAVNNFLMGNSGNNILKGEAGDDLIDGGLGLDTLIGGDGNDTYIVDTNSDVITEGLNKGIDTVQTLEDYALSNNNVENIILLGDADLNGTGNNLANLITGNGGNNELAGGSENDTLIGGAGDDVLDGGIANDILYGRLGADEFLYDSGVAFSAADFGSDRIGDFNEAEGDQIVLGKTTFNLMSNEGNGFSKATEFASVTTDDAAKGSDASIVYSSETGNIFYNQNGSTIGGESILTNLSADSGTILSSLSASDFTIV